jgi:hypothetical protein
MIQTLIPTAMTTPKSESALPPAGAGEYPPIDFTMFILSMSTSALMHLGETLPGVPGAPEVNLPLARQTIDILGVLEEKTRGNLTGEEERLMTQILFDLRMRFLEKSKA